MKYYSIVYPSETGEVIEEVLSEQDILNHYWEYWYEKMVKADKSDEISSKDCIDMWCMINWAVEITEEEYNEHLPSRNP